MFILFQVLFGGLFFLLFCVLRTRLRAIYSPRVRLLRGTAHAPPLLPPGFFAWIKPLILLDEASITTTAGLDATMYLRFLYLSFQLFAAASVLGCGVILPVNVYYDNLYYAELEDGNTVEVFHVRTHTHTSTCAHAHPRTNTHAHTRSQRTRVIQSGKL